MTAVIQRCQHCGFDIPSDEPACVRCRPDERAPSLAARQVAGLALPTRSTHPLPHLRPGRERAATSIGPAGAARALYEWTWVLLLVTLAGLTVVWVTELPRVAPVFPDVAQDPLESFVRLTARTSVVTLALGLLASGAWCVRWLYHRVR